MVKASRETGEPLDPNMMLEGFLKVRYSVDSDKCSNILENDFIEV